jgi:hypothetical protein
MKQNICRAIICIKSITVEHCTAQSRQSAKPFLQSSVLGLPHPRP